MNISYEKFMEIIPKETKTYVKSVLKFLYCLQSIIKYIYILQPKKKEVTTKSLQKN